MPPTDVRRFSIADIMILVPAAALGALILRHYMVGMRSLPRPVTDPWGFWHIHSWASGPVSCAVVPLMAAVIVLRLRPPRPRWRRIIGQPGFVACLAVMVALLPGLAWLATIQHRPGFQRAAGFEQMWVIARFWTDTAVLGSWIALALSRRWRPEPSWIDRMGRALGLYWVLLFLAMLAIQWIQTIQQLLTPGAAL